MDIEKLSKLNINPKLASIIVKAIKLIPSVRRKYEKIAEKEFSTIMEELESSVKPYKETFTNYKTIPEKGISKNKILKEMRKFHELEEKKWQDGYVSGAVYHGDEHHIDFLNKVYSINSQSNPLHSDIWPSTIKYEAEIISMTGSLLGAKEAGADKDSICGTISSGGTESIMLAMKAYRDFYRIKKGIKKPEIIIPVTAHAAFDKASEYFNIKLKKVPVDNNYMADISAVKKAVTRNTIVIAASAPTFPHGIIDPIEELSEIAYKKKIGFHTDACLGGLLLPWIGKLGYKVPKYDFRLRGVTSISADTHKYGYAAKGTSVILYRSQDLRHYQYFKTTEWPGGLYFSPTFAGSRPGALSAACWASLVSIGEEGYLDGAKKIMAASEKIKKGISEIPELFILGDPLWVIAFGSKDLNIYRIMDFMAQKKWSLNGLHKPSCIHLCVTLRHTGKGIAERFLRDLKAAVKYVKQHPDETGDMAPIYGMAATIPDRSLVSDLLDRYLDLIYKI